MGKTSLLTNFAKRNFTDLIYINLEKTEHRRLFPEDISLPEFEKTVNLYFRKSFSPDTFLFIDEIQEAPQLLTLFRFLYEDKPSIPLAAAGSLFEIRLKEMHISLPVGRVEYCFLYPLDFLEFLEAVNESLLAEYIKKYDFKERIPSGIHTKLLELYYEYCLIGGMPEAVKIYAQTKDLNRVNEVYSNLFLSFKDDVYKYSSPARAKYVNFVLENAPLFAGSTITYEKFSQSLYKSREISFAFDLLQKTMLLYQVRGTKNDMLPLFAQRKKAPKLIFLDTGLTNYLMGIQPQYNQIKDLGNFYRGRIAEQTVGQNLISGFYTSLPDLYYWYGKGWSEAELDYCINFEGKIVGFEIKSGKSGKLRSAHEFLKRVKNGIIIRIYAGEFRKDKEFISLPFYLIPVWKNAVKILCR